MYLNRISFCCIWCTHACAFMVVFNIIILYIVRIDDNNDDKTILTICIGIAMKRVMTKNWEYDLKMPPSYRMIYSSLRWRHNERDGVSNQQLHDRLPKPLFRRRSRKTSKLRVTGLCEANSPVTGEFPAQRASNAENVSIWWRHHEKFFSAGTLYHTTSCFGLASVSIKYTYRFVVDSNMDDSIGIWSQTL